MYKLYRRVSGGNECYFEIIEIANGVSNMSTYDPLKKYLLGQRGNKSIQLSFQQFDSIIGSNNAKSKYYLRQWWQNSNIPEGRHVQAKAWQSAGWFVNDVDLKKQVVTFVENV